MERRWRVDFRELLQEWFGFSEFRPGQERVLAALWERGAALAVFPTGGGKSLCYQLPALAFEGVTLIVSPLIALMKDQIDFLQRRGIAAARLDSSLSAEEYRDVLERMRTGTLKLVYVAPERFNNERFLEVLKRTRISLFAVDEAHCISEWGHNFRPDYLKLAETAQALGVERVLALTATATPSVVRDICAAFAIPDEDAIVTGFYRPNLNLATTPVSAEGREALLLKRLQNRKPGPTIVYVTLQRTAERIATLLQENGFPAEAYHAGMESEERKSVQDRWMESDRGIVVATIAFGMGIDKANVRYVYHLNLPKSLESYSQEIGRAGRDSETSVVEMLACPEDIPTLENFAYGDTPTEEALFGLIEEVLAAGEEEPDIALDLYDLSSRHDLRPLVLKTALTYLELMEVLRQGTPFYAGYAIRPHLPVPEIVAKYSGEPAQFVQSIFETAKKGKIKYHLNPDDIAEALGQERRRVVRALEVLEEKGWIELSASEVRQRYRLLRPDADAVELAEALAQRFARREEQEVARLQQVLEIITLDRCQINALVGYFGEKRDAPCGHCTYCVTGKPQAFRAVSHAASLPGRLDMSLLEELRGAHPEALGDTRQAARFLCGLTSPAQTRAKLSRHELFGAWEAYRFREVMEFLEANM